MARRKKPIRPPKPPKPGVPIQVTVDGSLVVGDPQFGEPTSSPDPSTFVQAHGSDSALYNLVQKHLLQAVPRSRTADSVMTLADAWGAVGPAKEKAIQKNNKIVFHCVGDTGSVKGPQTQSLVADKLAGDFAEVNPAEQPSFLYHLGDIVYSFGEAQYYYDQFYEPYRAYAAPIFAAAGNHDGMVYSGDNAPSLEAFLRNFVNVSPVKTPESGSLSRTAMTQPGVYFTLNAPFVTIIGLYSNVLEDPGVISSEGDPTSPVDDQQLTFLVNALQQAKGGKNAVLLVTHHPPFTGGATHGGSPKMLADIDKACKKAGFWPHAHLSGHAHNYQRFTRTVNQFDIPYVVCGNGGHGLSRVKGSSTGPLRTPVKITNGLLLENFDDQDYGYLRVVVDAKQLRIEFHDATPAQQTKSPIDAVTVDLATHQMISN